MASKAAVVEIQVKADAADAISDVGKAEAALKDLEQAAHGAGAGADGIKELTEAVADLTAATEDASEGAGGLADAFAAGAAGGALVAGISALGGAVKAAFTKLAELGMDAFSQAMEFDVGRDKLQAQLGLTAEQAKVMGKLAGDLYSQAYGESIGEVNEALRLVTLNLGINADQQAQELQQVTASVLDLATAFDQDLGGVARAVGQLMRTGLARDSREALDVITRGFQLGADKGEDLLDTLNEYPTLFRDIGLKADQAMGLMVQGLKAGARDTDQIADALGVFAEMSKTASDSTREAFQTLGLDAEKMLKVFGEGGPEAAAGLDQVLDGLRAMTDPVKQNETAVALFGDKANELQDALFALDPSTAVDALGQVGGAAEEMGKALADNATTRFETWKRTVQTNVITFIADNLLPALDSVGGKAQESFNEALEAWNAFQRGFTGFEPVAIGVDDGKLNSSISAIEGMDPTKGSPVLQQFQDLGEEVRKLADEWLPKLKSAIDDIATGLENLKHWMDENKEAMELLKIFGVLALIGSLVVLLTIVSTVVGAVILFGTVLLLALGPIALAIRALQNLGIEWDRVFEVIKVIVRNTVQQIQDQIGGMAEFISGVIRTVQGLLSGDWSKAWQGAKDAVHGAVQFITGALSNVMRTVRELLDLIARLRGEESSGIGRAITIPRSAPGLAVAPSALGPSQMTALGGSFTTINVSVQHTGLGVDSPRLQRDLVETLRRYERRNGPSISHAT